MELSGPSDSRRYVEEWLCILELGWLKAGRMKSISVHGIGACHWQLAALVPHVFQGFMA